MNIRPGTRPISRNILRRFIWELGKNVFFYKFVLNRIAANDFHKCEAQEIRWTNEHRQIQNGCTLNITECPILLYYDMKLILRWPCELCKFVSSYKSDLNRHVKIVHNGYALSCDQCDFSTPHQYVLNKHKEKHQH